LAPVGIARLLLYLNHPATTLRVYADRDLAACICDRQVIIIIIISRFYCQKVGILLIIIIIIIIIIIG
jgi:hypothetical protein